MGTLEAEYLKTLPYTVRREPTGAGGGKFDGVALPAVALLMAALTSGGVSAATGGWGGGGLPRATGDPRDVGQPEIPASCAVLHADLSTADGTFSSADEATRPTRRASRRRSTAVPATQKAGAPSGGAKAAIASGRSSSPPVTMLMPS